MADEEFHEIQLNGKQLVFLFMAGTVAAVVIFLCGLMVGRNLHVHPACWVGARYDEEVRKTVLEVFLNPEDKFFGFWVWCEDAEAGNPYAGECHGSLYFYGIALTKGVSGTLSEGPDGIYHMTVSSRDGKVSCTLWNASPVITRGLTNTVNAICAAPAGSGTSPHSVVQVTGH